MRYTYQVLGRPARFVRGVGLLAAFTALSVSAAPPANGPEVTTSGGYSIFDETMADMTWQEVEKLANPETIVLFPVGSIEEHGPQNVLGVDTYSAYVNSKLLRRELQDRGFTTVIAPPVYWAVNVATGAFPGSFSVRPSTLTAVLVDALGSLRRWGFLNVFVVNNHGDPFHQAAIVDAIKTANQDTGIRAYLLTSEFNLKRKGWEFLDESYIEDYLVVVESDSVSQSPAPDEYVDRHAGGGETSSMAYYFPDLVNEEIARNLEPAEVTWEEFQTKWLQGWELARTMTPLGYVGYPARFDAEQGKEGTEIAVERRADAIETFMENASKLGELQK